MALVNRKRSLVLVSFPMDDIARKYANNAPKTKRTKSTTRITFDNATRRNIFEVATYSKREGDDKLDLKIFEVIHTDLGVMNHETKEH